MSEPMTASALDPAPSVNGALDLVTQAAKDGAADAQAAANRAWEATEVFLSRFLYTTCYTISYGVVFPSTLLARSVPKDNAAVRGLIDGAAAAVRKVEEFQGLPAVDPAPAL